ncbi:MAG TPA: hypothetical protein VN039_07830 [Nitrospira sp.]|nr:hypothetical protein [Nitrospira sp.]
MKLKWKVQPEPTGKYRAFEKRGWPYCEDENGRTIAFIQCDDSYSIRKAAGQDHSPLTVLIRCGATSPEERKLHGAFRWRKFKTQFSSLTLAKFHFEQFVKNNPNHCWDYEDIRER